MTVLQTTTLKLIPFIEHCSYADIQSGYHYDAGDNSLLIQIVDPDMDFPEPKYPFAKVLQLKFLDVENADGLVYEHAITPDQARDIATALVEAYGNGTNVIVHCVAGVCRSGAVADVGAMLGFRDSAKFRAPNAMVKSMLIKQCFGVYGDEDTPLAVTTQSAAPVVSTPHTKYKVSGTGWLCALNPDGKWDPILQLTPSQLAEVVDSASGKRTVSTQLDLECGD